MEFHKRMHMGHEVSISFQDDELILGIDVEKGVESGKWHLQALQEPVVSMNCDNHRTEKFRSHEIFVFFTVGSPSENIKFAKLSFTLHMCQMILPIHEKLISKIFT